MTVARLPDPPSLPRLCVATSEQATELAGRCIAVLESCLFDAVIASVTAARVQELWLPPLRDDRVHVATATPGELGRAMTRTRRPGIAPHRFQLRDEDIVLRDGVLMTSPARTWRDLAMVLPVRDLVAAGDSVLRGGTTLDELRSAVEHGSQQHNVRRARVALTLLDARSRSRPESLLRVAVSGPDMPKFEVNETITDAHGQWLAEPDLSLAAARLALEYQGAEHAELRRMRKDITRFGDLRRADWLVIPFGPAEVFDRPWVIKPDVRAELRARAPHLLAARRRSVAV